MNAPLRVGVVFAVIAMLLAVVGIVRGNIPLNPVSILLALLISGGSWGVVSWAVATAVMDVEEDVAAADEPERGADQAAAAATAPTVENADE